MQLKRGYNPLVIVGDWNRAIFTPNWVSKYIFEPDTDIHIEIPTSNITNSSFKYNALGISFNISERRLQFFVSEQKNELFQLVGEKALTICRLLPHTPVSAFGINHIFKCSSEELDFSTFDMADESKFIDYTIKSVRHQRRIQVDTNCILTLDYGKVGSNDIDFNFNYNFDINSLDDFLSLFDPNNIVEKKIYSEELLIRLYNLSME